MPRFAINVTRNGTRVFSTSRSSITSVEQLKDVASLLNIIIEGAPEGEGLKMDIVCITPGTAHPVNADGTPIAVIPEGALPPESDV